MDSKQHKYDVAYLRMAREWAELSYCKRRQVGAIIVKDRMIISDGYNGTQILKVAKSTQNCGGATLYITLSPCKDCSKLVHQSGITRVVYHIEYKDTEGLEFLKKAGVELKHIPNLDSDE